MPVRAEIFFGKLSSYRLRSFINFRDDDERATGLQDSENFAHVGRQVGPEEVRFHGRGEIEGGVRKWQLRHGALPDLDPGDIDPSGIGSLRSGDARLGVIDAVDLSLRRDRCQLTHGSAAATTYVQDGPVFVY